METREKFTHLQEKRLGLGSPLLGPEQLPFALPGERRIVTSSIPAGEHSFLALQN